ncbi:MAG: transglycosylase SLT domain-containing protein [Nitrospiraceae bacterium]|nr:transglycosylase SLT domain-containing protein [Nitrospiraceae bacterium]
MLLAAVSVGRIKKESSAKGKSGPLPAACASTGKEKIEKEKNAVLEWMSRGSGLHLNVVERIYNEAHRHRFPDVLIAIAKVESNFDPDAISDKGALGLMQVLGSAWTEELRRRGIIHNEDDLFNVSKCMDASAYILDKYMAWNKGNLDAAIIHYGGPADHAYLGKILAALEEIRKVKGGN